MRPRAWQRKDLDAKQKAWNQVKDARGRKVKSQSQARGLRLEPMAFALSGDRAGTEAS